jgi:hypothetical protein
MHISDFSKHLFWDVDINKLDISKNKEWFIRRVLNYGLLNDWLLLLKLYDAKEIAEISKEFRDLDIKSANLISLLSGIPLNQFRCYITKQSTPNFWNS